MRAFAIAAVYAKTRVARALPLGLIDRGEDFAHFATPTFQICPSESRDSSHTCRTLTYYQDRNITPS